MTPREQLRIDYPYISAITDRNKTTLLNHHDPDADTLYWYIVRTSYPDHRHPHLPDRLTTIGAR